MLLTNTSQSYTKNINNTIGFTDSIYEILLYRNIFGAVGVTLKIIYLVATSLIVFAL